jgi:GTPase SAR1 family protein
MRGDCLRDGRQQDAAREKPPSYYGSVEFLPASTGPWPLGQTSRMEAWLDRPGQPVSVALSPTADRLAVSVGQRLTVSLISGHPRGAPLLQLPCASSPGLAWSPDGGRLAFRDVDGRGRLLDLSGPFPAVEESIPAASFGVISVVAFSPDGSRLATLAQPVPGRMTLSLLNSGREVLWERSLSGNRAVGDRYDGMNLTWSPNGRLLACSTGTVVVWLVNAADGRLVAQFSDHSRIVTGLGWADNDWVLSASQDATLQLRRLDSSRSPIVIETIPAAGMIFVRERCTALIWSGGGDLLAWSLAGEPVQLWHRTPPPRTVATHSTKLAVSAVDGLLALVDAGATEVFLVTDWHRAAGAPTATTSYANAKVLLLGDSGVGKSGLAMVLAGEHFRPTESTHGRLIWRLSQAGEQDNSAGDREVLLWDLAGQPGYRIVHQLHLSGAAVALILFDSRSEIVPLAGVRYWARALRHANLVADGAATIFLVAARSDRGGITVSTERIRQEMAEFAISNYFETSAKEGTGISELRSSVLAAIDWEKIPKIASTALFNAAKQFVVDQKASGNLLVPFGELCQAFRAAIPRMLLLSAESSVASPGYSDQHEAASPELTAVFEGCVARLDSAGLVKRLRLGDHVLLQPELLDGYAGAIVIAARDDLDGLGSIPESQVINLRFPTPSGYRVPVERLERLLVFATLEELIQNELVLREPTEEGVRLVFPSEYRRDLPVSEEPKGDGVVFRFEGPIANIYATLIVRLTRSNRFNRVATWQNAARFAADAGECTVFLKSDEGTAELWIGYDGMPDPLRLQFEQFVHAHLNRRATPETVSRERQYSCPDDNTRFPPEVVVQVRELGRESILCPVCEKRIQLHDDYDLMAGDDHSVAAMDASADAGRDFAVTSMVLLGEEEVDAEFDIFLFCNPEDTPAVHELARKLRERGLRPWPDQRGQQPGIPWQRISEESHQDILAAAVIVGSHAAPWQDRELTEILQQFVRRRRPVIPVLLPGAVRPALPAFLEDCTWVDLTVTDPDPFEQLERQIMVR